MLNFSQKASYEIASQTLLQEKLNCTALQEKVILRIGKPNEAGSFKDIGPDSYFLGAKCDGKNKVVDLYYNASQNFIVTETNFPTSVEPTNALTTRNPRKGH